MRGVVAMATLLFSLSIFGQRGVKIVFYDVGRLYDTVASPFYDDRDYTPRGKRGWSGERYELKVNNIARAIDSLSAEIVVLYGVESQSVVRDLVMASSGDYSHLHRTIDYYNGLDFAMLYYGDILFVERVSGTNSYTSVVCEVMGRRVGFHLTRRGDKVQSLEQPAWVEPVELDLLWGRFSRRDILRLGAEDLLRESELSGHGDSRSEMGWYLANRLGVRSRAEGIALNSGIYISRWLLGEDLVAPNPTFLVSEYKGGYSNILPQFIHLEIK